MLEQKELYKIIYNHKYNKEMIYFHFDTYILIIQLTLFNLSESSFSCFFAILIFG